MDKITTMKLAFEFLKKDFLYGVYNGKRVMDYLLDNADKIVRDNINPSELAFQIDASMYDKETEEPLYKSASERVQLPHGAILDVGEEEKKDYMESFIESLPYSGEIYLSKDVKTNIAEVLRSKLPAMNDDYTIKVGLDGKTKTLQEVYATILNNEYVPVTKMDKMDIIMEGVRRLRESNPDFEEISNYQIDSHTFLDDVKALIIKMSDNFAVTNDNGEEVLATDEMYKIFKKYRDRYREDIYNSIDSKPNDVEEISLGRNKEDNQLEVTSNYYFLRPVEITARTSDSYSEVDDMMKKMLTILDGIREAKSIEMLDEYDKRIAETWENIKEQFGERQDFKTLYEKVINESTAKQNELMVLKENEDDIEMIFRPRIADFEERINRINTDFNHTYEDPSKELEQIRYEFMEFVKDNEQMKARLTNEIEGIKKKLNATEMRINYSIDNVNHIVAKKKQEIEDSVSEVYFAFRRLYYSIDKKEKAAAEVSCERLAFELNRMLENYRNEGYITDGEYENYRHDLNVKLDAYQVKVPETEEELELNERRRYQ